MGKDGKVAAVMATLLLQAIRSRIESGQCASEVLQPHLGLHCAPSPSREWSRSKDKDRREGLPDRRLKTMKPSS